MGGNMGMHQQQMVPPTPNSVEMHGDVGRYLQQLDAQTRAIIEHEFKMRQQDAVSAPLLSLPLCELLSGLGGLRTEMPMESDTTTRWC